MSCNIMQPKSIARIANYICDTINNGYNSTHIDVMIPDEFKKFVCDQNGKADPEKVYKTMYKLNYDAFNTRYEGRHAEELELCSSRMLNFKEYDDVLTGLCENYITPNCYQMLKSIQCYLYQCAESAELENSIVYQTVKRFEVALKDRIVCQLPLYEAAEWD